MTLAEYAQRISYRLVEAHNGKDSNMIMSVLEEAKQELEDNDISRANREWFWEKVRELILSSDRLVIEKQSNSALMVLIQAIDKEIAARLGKDK